MQLSSYIATSGSAGSYNGQICQSVADNGARGTSTRDDRAPVHPRRSVWSQGRHERHVLPSLPELADEHHPRLLYRHDSNKNNYNFQPGNYFFKGAIIDVGGNDALNITGNGVTLAFDTSSTIKTRGSGTLNLNISAPTSGPYQGFSIVGSPSLELHGNSNFNAQGASTCQPAMCIRLATQIFAPMC